MYCYYIINFVFGVQETIATGINFADYDQQKRNNKSLDEKLEERNEVRMDLGHNVVSRTDNLSQAEMY